MRTNKCWFGGEKSLPGRLLLATTTGNTYEKARGMEHPPGKKRS